MSAAECTVEVTETGWYIVVMKAGDEEIAEAVFTADGQVLYLDNYASGWENAAENFVEPGEEETYEGPAEGEEDEGFGDDLDKDPDVIYRETLDRKLEYPFLAEVNPDVYQQYTEAHPIEEGENELLTHYNGTYVDGEKEFNVCFSETYMDSKLQIKYVVQIKPVTRIVFFDVSGDPNEGGNG